MTTIDYVIIIGYMLSALGVGLYFSKKASKDTKSYFLGNRSFPWWMIGISMVATSFASDTPLAITEQVREHGLQRLWWVLMSVMTLIVGIFLFSRLWRRADIVTDAQFYELRYEGRSAAFLRGFRAFFSGVVGNMLTMAWVIYGMSTIFEVMMPEINRPTAIYICIAVALIYATSSGFYGVVVTDLVQFAIGSVAMIALACIAVSSMGGMEQVLTTVAANPDHGQRTLSIFPVFTPFNMDTANFLIFILVIWWGDASGYNMQRMSACRNEKDAVKATIFYAIFQTIRPWIWVVVGLVSIALFPSMPEGHPDSHAYPLVMNEFLGPGMRGLLVAAFLAAFMSTIDTHLNWGASYMVIDVYQRFIKKEASDKHYMLVTKIIVVLLMLAAALIVPLMNSVSAAWEFLALLMVGSGMISVVRWFWWRINAYTEITALSLGLIIGFANLLIPNDWSIFNFPWGDIPFAVKIASFTAIVIPVSLIVTFLTPPVSIEKLEAFYRQVRPGGAWSGVSQEARNLPGKALGPRLFIDIIAAMLMCYGLSLAIGYAILMKFGNAGICLALAVLGAVIVGIWFKKEVRLLESYRQAEASTENHGETRE